MFLKYFYDRSLAQASYMVGCTAAGEALVIDPARAVEPYLAAAEAEGVRITGVTETHIHADFVSGSRELAYWTGARLYLSDMGGPDWKYAFADENTQLLRDGDSWMVGSVRIDVIHTPGHTPEHLIFQITDTAAADRPVGLFTGDCLFVGDVGRPDLLEEAAGQMGTKEIGARQQFQNVSLFKQMADYLQVWPGHGAGSACGKSLGAMPSTTMGYEKLFNPAFQIESEAKFVEWLLDGQPEAPRYFGQMKRVNRLGPALLDTLMQPRHIKDENDMLRLLGSDALLIDTRSGEEFAEGHIPGTLNVPGHSSSFSTYAGWYIDYDKSTYLVASDEELPRLLRELRAIGVDHIPGYFTPDMAGRYSIKIPQLNVDEAYQQTQNSSQHTALIDVRGENEYRERRIPGARNIPMGHLPRRIDELPRDDVIILQCSSGVRSQVAASLLQRYGLKVANLRGGIDAWRKAGLPVVEG